MRCDDPHPDKIRGPFVERDQVIGKATYTFNARCSLRVIGQYVEVARDPSLYSFPVPAKSGSFDGSG